MKAFLILLSVVCTSLLSHAEIPAGYTKVPENKLEDYRKAVQASLAQNPLAVSACDPGWVRQTIDMLDEVLVSKDSAQPLLLLNTYYPVNDGVLHRLAIFTTPDLKQITKVLAEVYAMGEVNKGDLAHPVIVQDYVLQNRVSCTPENQHSMF